MARSKNAVETAAEQSGNPNANAPGVTAEGVQDADAAPKAIQIDSKVDPTFDPTVSGAVYPGPVEPEAPDAFAASADLASYGTSADARVAQVMVEEGGDEAPKGTTRFISSREEGSAFSFLGVRSVRSSERPGHLEWHVPNDRAKDADESYFLQRGRIRRA